MRISLVGPGRAGSAVALAAARAGIEVIDVAGRDPEAVRLLASAVGARPVDLDAPVRAADVVLVAVRDDAIEPVSAVLDIADVGGVAHLSGAASVEALRALATSGVSVGSFHPLQTLPTAEAGAARLAGAWIAITAEEPFRSTLRALAGALGANPFDLADDAKALYHAAAAAAANFPLAALTMAYDLFTAAGVPYAAAQPLVEAVVANAFELGPRAALTGPVARGDTGTVRTQLAAVAHRVPAWESAFRDLIVATAHAAGREAEFGDFS